MTNSADSSKPNALIFGGLNTYTRGLVSFLVPQEGEALVGHVRIVDKYSVHPPTTYLGAEFRSLLEKPQVEYIQRNLTVASVIEAAFDPPNAEQTPYDIVFDLTGEVRHDRQDMVHMNTTVNTARMIALEASKRKVRAYVRLQLPFYETSSKGSSDEKDDPKPSTVAGIWWHETLRVLASIEDLNLVILRVGFGYGPYVEYGTVTTLMTVASVYGYLKKPMRSMWSPGKNPTNTVHVADIAGGLWACAEWMAKLGRKAADEKAGEEIKFHNDKSRINEVKGMPPHDKTVVAPLFNLVDDSNHTLLSLGQTATSFFNTTFEFFNFVETSMLKMMSDAIEDINEHHVGGWTEMVTTSQPPVPNTPLSAYMDEYMLSKQCLGFSNNKIKTVIGYQLQHPQLNHDEIRDIVEKWKAEGSWPILENQP